MKSTLRRSAHLLLAVASPLATLIACEKIAGIDDMSAYEDTGDAGIASCTLGAAPPPAHTALRFGNLTPSADTVDFCVKPSTAPSYGPTTMLKQFGNCPAVSYGQVLIPLGVEPGTYDIKVVAGSASNCSAAALSEILGVEVLDQRTVTVLRMGGVGDAAQKVAEKLVALPEVRFPMGQSTRLVNAIASTEKILFGLVESDHLPTKVTLTIGGEIPMGGTPAATDKALGIGPINDAGYFSSHQTAFNFGASRSGQQDAVLIAVLTPSPMYTIYAVGLPGSYEYPVRALICREDKLQGAGTNGVTADYRTNCELSPLKQITIDTVNIGLYGANAPFLEQRRDPALEALANLDSDVLCVQEIPRAADREQLITNAKAKWVAAQQDQRPWEKMSGFPHAFNPTFDLSTQIDDPLDQSGNMPPSLGAYCADSLTRMQAALDCTAKNCAADPGNTNSTIARDHTNCLSRKCTKDYTALLS
ncbi:MAG: hypothetical protein MUF54_25060, partial [Polyangiaceae bacterium]|nr:hypothetical protein [Polyangiaceae bacterium]